MPYYIMVTWSMDDHWYWYTIDYALEGHYEINKIMKYGTNSSIDYSINLK